jgi:peptide/nickel transport system substrate-binding protein
MSEKKLPRRPIAADAVTRRSLLRGAAAGTASLALLAAACRTGGPGGSRQGAKSGAGGSASKTPKSGGVLTYGGGNAGSYDTRGPSFDPHQNFQFAVKGYQLFFERLLSYDLRSYKIGPELAQKWEQPSQTEYLFSLQPNVKFHNKPPVNGRALTADDVVYSYERARTNDPRFSSRSLLANVDKIEAPDSKTVRITTKARNASTLGSFSVDNLSVLAKEAVEKFPKMDTAEGAVGTGAFIVKSYELMVGAEYVRNPEYWKSGLPYLDSIRTKHFNDLTGGWAAYLAGGVDASLVPGQEVKSFISQQGPGFTPDWYADDTVNFQYPNTKKKPLDDARVVRALKLLIDHDDFIKTWTEANYGKGGYGSIFPTAFSAWDLTPEEYKKLLEYKQPKDDAVKEALSLLTAAGFSKSSPLKFEIDTITNPTTLAAAQLLQAQWKQLSQGVVDTSIHQNDQAQATQRRDQRLFSYNQAGQSEGLFDPDIWLTAIYQSSGSQNYMGYSDPQLDSMIDAQRTMFDETERKALIKKIVLYYIDHGPSTIGANRYFLQGVKPRVQNHAPEYFINGAQYKTVWLDS